MRQADKDRTAMIVLCAGLLLIGVWVGRDSRAKEVCLHHHAGLDAAANIQAADSAAAAALEAMDSAAVSWEQSTAAAAERLAGVILTTWEHAHQQSDPMETMGPCEVCGATRMQPCDSCAHDINQCNGGQ